MVNLEVLSVSFADNMRSEGLASISQLSKLEWLKIRRGAELEPNSFVSAFKYGQLHNLVHLNLSECSQLDDKGVMSIAKQCPNLGVLQLDWCWEVTDIGVLNIVSCCKFLINLQLCGVVRLEGDFLPLIPQCLTGLKLLDLEQCPDIELEDLRELLTQKQVRYHGASQTDSISRNYRGFTSRTITERRFGWIRDSMILTSTMTIRSCSGPVITRRKIDPLSEP